MDGNWLGKKVKLYSTILKWPGTPDYGMYIRKLNCISVKFLKSDHDIVVV